MDIKALVEVTQSQFDEAADPDKAMKMAAYMKTDMPFYGVQKAGRTPILSLLKREHPPSDRGEYEQAVLALWGLGHREEKYMAIGYARAFDEFIVLDSLPLFERLIVEGAWWDLVDGVASWLVGGVLAKQRSDATPRIRSWITDDDMWLRRTSIICQLGHKADTDIKLFDDACTQNLADPEFFIRKAIGWSLREYAKTDPDWVRHYVDEHRSEMAPLSMREATKHL